MDTSEVQQAAARDLSDLQQSSFDVTIVGGGVSGAWLALHCAQLGLRTALIERADYASQTSSSSSKLIHGGIRYLQQMQFGKVRESALERAHYVYAAPHLSVAVPFVIPTYRDFQRSKLFLNCGMLAYRFLSLGENRIISSAEQKIPPIRSITAQQLNQICDLSNQPHTGGVVFYERHMPDSERMVLAILQTARGLGAHIHNYVGATRLCLNGKRVTGLEVKDQLAGSSFKINSKLVVNAAGPWIDELNSQLDKAQDAPKINGFAVGSHIVTRQLCDHAIAITTKHQSDAKIDRGGRHVFIIPWRGYSLIGTSYNEIASPQTDLSISADHVDQLLEAVNQGIPSANLSRDDLVSGYSGLYPLQTENIKHTVYQGSGEYQIIDHANANGIDGMITALGAKFTTGRKLSTLSLPLIIDKLGLQNGGAARAPIKLACSDYANLHEFTRHKQDQYSSRFAPSTVAHLVQVYGSQVDEFIDSLDSPELEQTICQGQADLLGQVKWAVLHEQAVTLHDVVFHRTSLGLLGIEYQSLQEIAEQMAKHLHWSEQHVEQQIEQVWQRINTTQRALRGT